MARIPTKRELRHWTVRQLERMNDFIEDEFQQRYKQEAAAEEAEREERQREEAAERARTLVRTRYIQQAVRCGKPSCHCMRGGDPHPGYWYRIETYGDGRRRKRYEGKQRPRGAPKPAA